MIPGLPQAPELAPLLSLETDARALAASQADLARTPRLLTRSFYLPSVARALQLAQKHLAKVPNGATALPKAAEWFLDNFYLIRRVARQVEEELPRGFVRHLPQLASGTSKGMLRIDALARAFVSRSKIELELADLERFLVAYQEVSPLTIAELWALPSLLRACVLQHLLALLEALHAPALERDERIDGSILIRADDPRQTLLLDPSAGVERSIHALRLLDSIDWKALFERTNRVQAILCRDPAGVYARMDFETCDAYRKAVEAIAWSSGRAEEEVALLAVALAAAAPIGAAPASGDAARRGHVGYYLVAQGRAEMEARLGGGFGGLEALRRLALRFPTRAYLGLLSLFTLLPLAAAGWLLWRPLAHPVALCGGLAIAALPFSLAISSFLQAAFARLLPPRTLPKLDFSKGIPAEQRTLVVIPALLTRGEDIGALVQQLELHYLSNPDPNLQFALLTDNLDSEQLEDDAALRAQTGVAIAALNARHGAGGKGPFHFLHRAPRWNEGEGRFMGWERKRGKLEELNRLLRGDSGTSYRQPVGERAQLEKIRFVLTLDSDTQLPMGSAQRLVGLLAHPLNHAVFDEKSGRVVAGYTIVQPRVETSPTSARETRFSRIFAGDIGFDIYTHACSELYQDLFGAGIYVGKGIYDVDAFMRSVDGRAPENALVSHDLFEGIHGRAALATDIVLFEGYPASYVAYARRMHRWLRGDWQLLPWLFSTVPAAAGARIPNALSRIDRWKIFDNLRRSLAMPLTLLLIASGLTWLPGSALAWVSLGIALLCAPLLPGFIDGHGRRGQTLVRAGLALALLAYESSVVLDAIGRVVVRRALTRKLLLQWTSAAQTSLALLGRSQRALFWQTLAASPLFAILLGAIVWLLRAPPETKLVALPWLALWFAAPELARWLSEPGRARTEPLTAADRTRLRLLARRTWRFFETFVGPNDQWLPIDNYQDEPNEQTAHRTSPTNIGLMLLATLSAADFGYLGLSELSLRLRRAFESIGKLQHYQGHLLNWYETKNLQPLLPRYVSTVDSGNFAGCLVALKQGCEELAGSPVLRAASFAGLVDALDLLTAAACAQTDSAREPLCLLLARIRAVLENSQLHPETAHDALALASGELGVELDRLLHLFLEKDPRRQEAAILRELRVSLDGFKKQLQQLRRELDALVPWLGLGAEAGLLGIAPSSLPALLRLDEIPAAAARLRVEALARVESLREDRADLAAARSAGVRLVDACARAETNAALLREELLSLALRAEEEVRGIDFRLLFDPARKLFHIGYNATVDQIDSHYYDLLASEARLASYLAIVKRDVPQAHWYALGRPMTRAAGAPALLSWGGTMFEYLMPILLMRSQEGTLLASTYAQIVEAQIAYARDQKEPWGISESAYAKVDARQTYQYRSFGVPGLGFKRGLEDDRVVAPYASLLALPLRPRAVVENLTRLKSMDMLGTYGFFEALDLTASRVAPGRSFEVVRSYMAHHQGMLLVSLGNALNPRSMVERFHASARVETGEVLLNEHAPDRVPKEWPMRRASEGSEPLLDELPRAPEGWGANDPLRRQAWCLSNGRMTSVVTDSGAGGLSWEDLALTRYSPDATCDEQGLWLYLRDEETRRIWRATSPDGRATFSMHKAEYHRREEGISVHVDVTIAPADDVEIRQITLHNETDRARHFSVTSAGQPVLFDRKQAPVHPAFSSLFLESEPLAELGGLLFSRRTQAEGERPAILVHRLVFEGRAVAFAGIETDRGAFHGRTSSAQRPRALAGATGALRGSTGPMLDPIFSVMADVTLPPKSSATFAFVTTFARTREAALELARKYGSMHAIRWAFRDGEQDSARKLQRTRLEPALVEPIQRLYSALLFADPGFRAPPDGAEPEHPNQRRLWAHGISGDDPILLVRVGDPAAQIVADALAAQRFLRDCFVPLDLVLIDEQATGYSTEGSWTLQSVLAQHEASDWLNKQGGAFVLAQDQLAGHERRHLEQSARVLLDTRDGSLAARLAKPRSDPPKLPRFAGALPDDPAPRPQPEPPRLFANGPGGFSADGREYLISVKPGLPTPAPWCNVLANAEFGCLTSESSLGATWSLNAGENRLTPWRNDPVFDTPSEALFLRDEETAAVWSPTPLPAGQGAPVLVRHGAGYTAYAQESRGLAQEMTVFVPAEGALKIVRLRLKNTMARHRRLTATYYAEWVLGPRRGAQRPFIESELDGARSCLLASCGWNSEFGGRVAFLAASERVHGFTTDRTEFLGLHGDLARPEVLQRWGLSGSLAPGVDPCAALQVHLELGPGAELETHFLLGQAASRAEALALVARLREPAQLDAAFSQLRAFWDGLLEQIQVKTPEPALDLMLNRWLLYQALASRFFGRTGFYQSSGAFGFRDQLQDVMALFQAAPQLARAHILESARHQFEEGDVLHWWHPPSGRGVRTRCSDDLAWLPYVAARYVEATGDIGILDAPIPFLQGAPLAAGEHDRYAQYDISPIVAPLHEHCRRALEKALTAGVHGLPLMGGGDWNDGMNRVGAEGRGESVWLAWFLSAAMDGFANLLDARAASAPADAAAQELWRGRARALRETAERSAWDGGWYLRAYHDDESKIGAASSRECRIDSIAQSWSVLAAAAAREAPDERAQTAMAAAETNLVRERERLVLLFWPPFDSPLHDPGYIRGYPAGIRENGGQYTHGATWLGFAHAAMGQGDAAARIFQLLNPILQGANRAASERYRLEPYALAGDVYSCAPWVGRGGWSWYTGAAAWLWRLGVEELLGLRLRQGKLHLDPCIPSSWPGFEAWIQRGQSRVHVVVENPARISSGALAMTWDGAPHSGALPIEEAAARTHELRVTLVRR